MALTAEAYNRPPIPFVDINTGKKIRLRLRTMSFEREIGDMNLPADMLERHRLFIFYRNKQHEDRYMMVAVWRSFAIYERYWISFGFQSEEEYLIYYGLPDGSTLAGVTIMVSLFDKATFILLGEEVLSYMIRAVGEYQKDTDARKKNYQAIFDRYCEKHEAFDKATFYDEIRRYIIEVYEQPLAEQEGLNREQWLRERQIKKAERTKRRVIVKAIQGQQVTPRIEHDFEWREERCPYCLSKITIIEAFQNYTRRLETIIREKLGAEQLPEKPPIIQNL